jgi:hypothetical protein
MTRPRLLNRQLIGQKEQKFDKSFIMRVRVMGRKAFWSLAHPWAAREPRASLWANLREIPL